MLNKILRSVMKKAILIPDCEGEDRYYLEIGNYRYIFHYGKYIGFYRP